MKTFGRLILLAFIVGIGTQSKAQTSPRLAWDHGSLSTVTGFAVTIDGVRTDHGRAPIAGNGTCGCSIPIPFSGGRHTVSVSAYNSAGETSSAPLTVAPSANAGGPYAGQVGSPIVVSGASSIAPTGSLVSYRWKWGDGSADTTSASAQASHAYSTGGSFSLTLTVTDNAGAIAAATTTVSVASAGLPSGWTQQDIGSVGASGSSSYANGQFTIKGAGADIWGTADSFDYVYQSLAGDGQIVARVASLQNSHTYAKAGVMIRETISSGSPHVLLDLRPNGQVELLTRTSPGDLTALAASATQPFPAWIKLVRNGSSIVASLSADGTNWSVVGTTNVAMGSNVLIGLAVCSHVAGSLTTALFDNVTVTVGSAGTPPATPTSPSPSDGATGTATTASLAWSALGATSYDVRFGTTNPPPVVANGRTAASYQPSPMANGTRYFWQIVARNSVGSSTGPVWSFTTSPAAGGSIPSPWLNGDVGAVGRPGAASYSSGTFMVSGSGADIWGTADAFHYVHQGLGGDGELTARITALGNTNPYAKAGLMMRAGLTPDAAHVVLDVRPNGQVEFMTRRQQGSSTTYLAGSAQSPPTWLKLARVGATVTGYVSRDGSAWMQVGSTTTTLPVNVAVGMIVSSHDNALLNTATFDSVAVVAGGSQPPPPSGSGEIVIYASDIPTTALHGSWLKASDTTSPNGTKLTTPNQGLAQANAPLASPTHYVDVTFTADAGKAYRLWLRMRAAGNSKYNDSVWVQFSDALVGGNAVYRINSTSGLLVNLATDPSAGSLSAWGWANGAYWLSQSTRVSFASGGLHTIRLQVREDGAELDQIVLSPAQYLNVAPGPPTNDSTIVPKP